MDKLEKLKEMADFFEVNLEDLKPTKEELITLILSLIPPPLKGEKGEDYVLTEIDKKEIASKIKVPIIEKVIEKTEISIVKEQPIITNEIKEVAKYETAEEIANKLNTLEEALNLEVIKGLKDRLNRTSNNSVLGGSHARETFSYSLSNQLNGVLTSFSLPSFRSILKVELSGRPVLEKNTHWTASPSLNTVTFTNEIDPAIELEAGQICIVYYNI